MNLGNLLNDVLSTGQKMLNQQQGAASQQSGNNLDFLKGLGGGAAAAGLLSMLLGGKGSKGLSGSVAKLGSMAAIGTLAYKAYQAWQAQNGNQTETNIAHLLPSHERASAQQEQNSATLLMTMIAAANADGRIDAQEQHAILAEVGHSDQETQAWLQAQLNNPQTPAQIAAHIGNDQALAAESYLAARIVCGDLDRKEIIFLHELAEALRLDDALVDKLEQQATS